jgi:23S rRNA (adenine2503-C2)-methyltransferase
MNAQPLIYDRTQAQLTKDLKEWGYQDYRARQIWRAIYDRLIEDPGQISDLPLNLREHLAETFEFRSLKPLRSARSNDGETEKTLFLLGDGQQVEAVLMRYDDRRTACISTQAGCAMGCVFCATGQMGFQRHLSAGEIVEQVLYLSRRLAVHDERLTNLVLMGMGEPFHNYGATMEAIDRLNDPDGFGFGARRITVSTVGLVPMIDRFARERRQVNLAVSLHAASDELRSQLLPINKRYPLQELFAACRRYTEQTGRRITFEWALIEGLNDTPQQAELLAEAIQDMLCHVNLIPLNPTAGYDGDPTPTSGAQEFSDILERRGITCTVRVRRGIDIQAGCGQLATQE